MRLRIDAELDYYFPEQADVLLALEVAQTPDQRLVEDRLTVDTATPLKPIAGHQAVGQRTWTAGEGRFVARYHAVVDVQRAQADIAALAKVALRDLPADAIDYLWPSRYCQSEPLQIFAADRFGALAAGGAQVAAAARWVRDNLDYVPGHSDATTTAHDTFHRKKGICRDFAHVLITMVRAFDIPARMVSAYAWQLDPPDFHAVVEVYLDGAWHLIDPTGLAPVEGLARIGVGRDATDVSFMTIFDGVADMRRQRVTVERLD
ncbi:MAG: transglutaminase family protein [Pseudomonadota bacterium]|nr:transglutaminase family protein [Pseudomonadota bacterium]